MITTKTRDIYEADDGAQFDVKEDALRYQARIDSDNDIDGFIQHTLSHNKARFKKQIRNILSDYEAHKAVPYEDIKAT